MRRRLTVAAAGVLLGALAALAACPYGDSSWQPLRASQKRELLASPKVVALDTLCLALALQRCAGALAAGQPAAKPIDLLMEYVGEHGHFGRQLLSAGLAACSPVRDTNAWKSVCRLWEQSNAPLRDAVQALQAQGELGQADSLYAAFEPAGVLGIAEVLEWAGLKQARRDYIGAARVLCDLSQLGERLAPVGRGQLAGFLREADSSQARQALEAYTGCALGRGGVDTLVFAQWLARTCDQCGLYDAELAARARFDSPRRPMLEPLLRTARQHLSLKRYAAAAAAARLAWERTQNPDLRAYCASVLCEAYQQLGKRDSAVLWLGRSDLAAAADLARAVAFYQGSGMLGRADSLLSRLPASTVRDTLTLRQLLLAGRADSAETRAAAMAPKPVWRSLPQGLRLWRVRIALFRGEQDSLRSRLDSLRFEPSWEYAPEVLGYRYHLERLEADAHALADWPAFEYALWRGDPAAARRGLHLEACTPAAAQLFVVRLVKAFLEQGALEQAAAAAGRADPVAGQPEHTYYCADVLLRQGRLSDARTMLEGLILAHPQSIYASKARLLLAHTRS